MRGRGRGIERRKGGSEGEGGREGGGERRAGRERLVEWVGGFSGCQWMDGWMIGGLVSG